MALMSQMPASGIFTATLASLSTEHHWCSVFSPFNYFFLHAFFPGAVAVAGTWTLTFGETSCGLWRRGTLGDGSDELKPIPINYNLCKANRTPMFRCSASARCGDASDPLPALSPGRAGGAARPRWGHAPCVAPSARYAPGRPDARQRRQKRRKP